jgi:hypothetical protein
MKSGSNWSKKGLIRKNRVCSLFSVPTAWKTFRKWIGRSWRQNAWPCILDRLLRQSAVEDILLDLYDRSRSRESFIAYFREMVNLISVLLRDIMILMVDGSSTTLINLDYKEKLMDLAALTNIDKVFFLIRKMEFLLRDVQRNLNARVLVLEFINSYAPVSSSPAPGSAHAAQESRPFRG